MLDGQCSQVGIADKVARRPSFGQQAGQYAGVTRGRFHDDCRRLGEPTAESVRRLVHAERPLEDGGVGCQAQEARSGTQAKPTVSWPLSAPSSQARERR